MSGGFLVPQFSTFDLDQDGTEELITFDRFSGIIQVWKPGNNDISYQIWNDAHIDWPVLHSWMQVRDFNQDAVPDLFTQGIYGIAVFKGLKEGSRIRFEKMGGDSFIDDSLIFRNKSGGTTNIYHASTDIPIIEDVDGDGDLDILTFELSGSYLYYYENQWDKSGKELDFTLKHNCWGHFVENQFSDNINLAKNQLDCPPPFTVRHSGSASCLVDVNQDSAQDLLLGDIGGKSLKMLVNHASPDTGLIIRVDPAFPDLRSPAILHYFPAAYKLDINQDGLNDIVVAVNDYPLTDFEGVWAYKGTRDTNQLFKLQTDQWLSDQYIDFGQYSSPYFININGDELLDILVGYQVTEDANQPQNKMAYFEALSETEYQLRTMDFGSLSEKLTSGYRPYLTAGDVDQDGDLDILVGMSDGTCYMIYNDSHELNSFSVENVVRGWADLEVLSGATPELFDLDGDGDLDVIAGTDNGTIGLYVNKGDKWKAVFDSDLNHDPNVKQLGQIRTIGENRLLGRSAPRIIRNGMDTILISGSQEGKIYTYRINTSDLTSEFDQIVLDGWPQWTGGNARIATDANPENEKSRLITGNIAGGLQEYLVSRVMTNGPEPVPYDMKLYPSPIKSGQRLKLSTDPAFPVKKINVILANGVIFHSIDDLDKDIEISTTDWLPGLYFVQIILQDNRSIVHKVIVQ